MIKLDPVVRQNMLFEIEMKTHYSRDYLDNRTDEELIVIYKERCQ